MRVDYLGLEAFVAVAELGSFSRAAQRLNLTQTALSHRIRKIEEDLGTRLLVRTSREVSLTMAGQATWIDQSNALVSAFQGAVQPFIVWDIVKMAFAALTVVGGWSLLQRK